jgi:hypothetical protein
MLNILQHLSPIPQFTTDDLGWEKFVCSGLFFMGWFTDDKSSTFTVRSIAAEFLRCQLLVGANPDQQRNGVLSAQITPAVAALAPPRGLYFPCVPVWQRWGKRRHTGGGARFGKQ